MSDYQHISHGFDPVFDERSRILVLGSFPSVLSRKNAFYYGNPQNRFWRVMAACLGQAVPPNEGDLREGADGGASATPGKPALPRDGANTPGSGRARKEQAQAGETGKDDGEGTVSLDESIAAKKRLLLDHGIALWDVIESCDIKGSSDASIKNVVPSQVEHVLQTAHIGAVMCNGGTAGRLYKRFLQWQVGLAAHVLPSTSPANASWGIDRLTERWRAELTPLLAAAADGTLGEAPSADSVKRGFVTAKIKVAKAAADENAGEAGRADGRGGQPGEGAAEVAEDDGQPTANDAARPEPRVEFATVRVEAPAASSWSVHKSMQGNKRANTKPELLVRERLRAAGLGGYRLQWKVPGHPDIAWPGKRVAIEVRGCFWHRCPHCNPSTPKKNVEYWEAKFARNVERDEENLRQLAAMGWRVHVVWECELKKRAIDETMAKLLPELAAELGKELREANSGGADNSVAINVDANSKSPNPAAHRSDRAATDVKRMLTESGASNKTADVDANASTQPRPHYMYVLECADGSLYTGYTPDVEARLAAHRAGTGAKYTRGRGPLNLLAVAEFATKHDAMSAEYRFKRLTRDQKDALLAKAANPGANFAEILQEAFKS